SGLPCANATSGPIAGFWATWDFINQGFGIPFPIKSLDYYINLTVCINTNNCIGSPSGWNNTLNLGPVPGNGAYIGLVWLNSTNGTIGATFSPKNYNETKPWTTDTLLALPSIDAPENTTSFAVVLVIDGAGSGAAYFDDVRLALIPSINPSTANIISDGFPSQAIQAYNACRNYGFDDDHIMMMIDTGDQNVNINATDSINDYSYHK
ncbi:MAG: hypothetical protein ACFFDN_16730, partial [Candidatus Hodarchaeota archaeon]